MNLEINRRGSVIDGWRVFWHLAPDETGRVLEEGLLEITDPHGETRLVKDVEMERLP